MNLSFSKIVRVDNGRSLIDSRRVVDRYTLKYWGDDGHEYRKMVETNPGNDPRIVLDGSHKAINSNADQWSA